MDRSINEIKLWHLVLALIVAFTPLGVFTVNISNDITALKEIVKSNVEYRKESERSRNIAVVNIGEMKGLIVSLKKDIADLEEIAKELRQEVKHLQIEKVKK
jgi:hypothetical protein